jgi:nucleoside-diphosphate-sugar epimerase
VYPCLKVKAHKPTVSLKPSLNCVTSTIIDAEVYSIANNEAFWMKILILGGTKFLGRHLTEAALKGGHQVTLFNRGMTNPRLFPAAEHLHGDRDGGLDALKGRRWDVAIDTCGYVPRLVKDAAEYLAGQVEHYTFISSISVYAEPIAAGVDESGRLQTLDDESTEIITGETYGGLKALCEQAAEAAMPGRVLNVRSGLIVGAHDPTDRFTYWPVRVAMGGEVLAPGKPERPVQFIDARDQAEWILRMAEARKVGIYNVTGPEHPLPMGELLEACQRVAANGATLTWVSEEFLIEQGVTPWMELPMWLPENYNNVQTSSVSKALADGLTFRRMEDTIRETLRWNSNRTPSDAPNWIGEPLPRAGMMQDREKQLLAAWKQKQ